MRGESSGRTAELAALATRAPKPSNDGIGDCRRPSFPVAQPGPRAWASTPTLTSPTVGQPRAVVISDG